MMIYYEQTVKTVIDVVWPCRNPQLKLWVTHQLNGLNHFNGFYKKCER